MSMTEGTGRSNYVGPMRVTVLLRRLRSLARDVEQGRLELESTRILLSQVLTELHAQRKGGALNDFEFSVFSQWGEDGILQHLARHLVVSNRTFVEFGVEDFREANCRLLLQKDGWEGHVIDGSPTNIERITSDVSHWRWPLTAKAAFITRDNVDALLAESGFDRDLGILSVDVDGIDYHLLEALSGWTPSIVVVEYNAVFGSTHAVTVPYDPGFRRLEKHPSGLYYGASLPAFDHLLTSRGYSLAGVNYAGNNAFFVRTELCSAEVPAVEIRAAFRDSRFRESRDPAGALTYARGPARAATIAALPVEDVTTGQRLLVRDLS
jgi:hypothetical protein